MNLEKLLAENMIRFGTRNLTERDVRKILKEQAAVRLLRWLMQIR
jgi:hypothetical protein